MDQNSYPAPRRNGIQGHWHLVHYLHMKACSWSVGEKRVLIAAETLLFAPPLRESISLHNVSVAYFCSHLEKVGCDFVFNIPTPNKVIVCLARTYLPKLWAIYSMILHGAVTSNGR